MLILWTYEVIFGSNEISSSLQNTIGHNFHTVVKLFKVSLNVQKKSQTQAIIINMSVTILLHLRDCERKLKQGFIFKFMSDMMLPDMSSK